LTYAASGVPYRIDLPGAHDAALDRLVELGALDVESGARGVAALMPDGVPPGVVAQALGVVDIAVSAAVGRDEDSVWTLSVPPVRVGAQTIRLSDTRVFGTGQHPTTALCLEMLVDLIAAGPPDGMLDVGTGSGVLAIAALKLGVSRATAIEIDAEAVRVAAENARTNRVADRLELVYGGLDAINGAWPLVVANVLAAPLIEMAPVLVRRIGRHGRLVLSGISRAVEPDVVRAYRRLGMHHHRSDERGGWIAALLQSSW
jgi:ribosomal protein L11 methyltransferase